MKNKIFLTLLSLFLSVIYSHAQLSKTIDVITPGTLSASLGADKTKVTDLTLKGTINDADFTTIKQMSLLKVLDMSEVEIVNGAIPASAFEKRVMDKIVLPERVKSVGLGGFSNLTISTLDFSGCAALESFGNSCFVGINITSGIIDLSGCTSLKSLGQGCFGGLSQHIILPSELKNLTSLSFAGFKGSVDLPSQLESIGGYAFQRAVLKELKLPASLKKVDTFGFTEIAIPELDFSGCVVLESLGNNCFVGNNITSDTLDLSGCISLKSLGQGCFGGLSKHVILPSTLKILHGLSFAGFRGSVDLPSQLESILGYAFQRAVLKELKLPASLKKVDTFGFTEITIPELDFSGCVALESLGNNCFVGNNITSDTLNLSGCISLKSLGQGCFGGLSKHVILPSELKNLTSLSFADFRGSIDLPSQLESIGSHAFQRAVLKELKLPASLKTVDKSGFTELNIPKLSFSNCINLETLGNNCFTGIKLESDTINLSGCRSLKVIGQGCFSGLSKHIILPSTLKILHGLSFAWFGGSVDLPAQLESVLGYSFQGASLKELIIPVFVKSLGDRAFENAKLETLVSLNPTPPTLGPNVFIGVNKTACTLYVPRSSISLYQAAAQWKDFLIEEYKVSLIDNLVYQKSTEENLYQVKTEERFDVEVYANLMSEVSLGLFNASNGTFIEDIVSSKNGNTYTCQVSTNLLSGSYLIQPYILEEDEVKVISRKAGSHIIDRLLITVKNNWAGFSGRNTTADLSNHLLINTAKEDLMEVNTDQSFKVLIRSAIATLGINVGLFNYDDGSFVSDITESVNGNVLTCKVASGVAEGRYTLIPYLIIDSNIVYIERSPDKLFLVDRLPLNVVATATSVLETRALEIPTSQIDIADLKVYPNPVTDILYLESGASISELQVYSTNGKLVLKQANVSSSINVSHLASGSYILKLQIGDKSYTHKLIKK
ncbi:leucine-rich repeat protein [Dysgonomonas sp. GY617]|uniref:leucine-rich repeat protein n=1 Tax=Dysgonomonas sp. GY617 TaxID=2780420 RepID=UPI00188336C5|nr:leucine-rich repeat protein [Dysgonomonas sp. GY617]MBF0576238.1 leucine-rich repeat protein [Dysgonomonas sp. GY617]